MIETLKKRFCENRERHLDLEWEEVEKRLTDHPEMLEILKRMEESGGEPDVIGKETASGKLIFCDCSAETPSGRRSFCYDEEALRKRSKNPPAGSAMAQAQELGNVDLKTSSWIKTPDSIREKGGALFCERRYGTVFVFHNGADSYYSVRGWRGYICF